MKKRFIIITILSAVCCAGCVAGQNNTLDVNVVTTSQDSTVIENTTEAETINTEDKKEGLAALTKIDLSEEILNTKTNQKIAYSDLLKIVEEQMNGDKVRLFDYELTIKQQQDLLSIAPDTQFLWWVKVGDTKINSALSEVDISGHSVKYLDGYTMEDVFSVLPNLTRIDMCNCGLTNEEYAKLCDENPDIRIIWEIVMSHWRVRTDVIAFSSMKTCADTFFMENDEAKYFKYCTDLVALDLGHNHVGDISFLQYLPELRVLILVDNIKEFKGDYRVYTNDLSVLQYCPKLKYLEFFVGDVRDLSFLQYTPEIIDLNISYNPISDATYLYNLPNLDRLWLEHTGISEAEYERLKAAYPNSTIIYHGEGSIDNGWREHPRFYAMRDMFNKNYLNDYFK